MHSGIPGTPERCGGKAVAPSLGKTTPQNAYRYDTACRSTTYTTVTGFAAKLVPSLSTRRCVTDTEYEIISLPS